MNVCRERIQVLEGVGIWQTRKVKVREVAVLSEVGIRLLNIIEVSIVLHGACGDEWSLTSRSRPHLLLKSKFDSTSLLNSRMVGKEGKI
jgi:hypothetical protein